MALAVTPRSLQLPTIAEQNASKGTNNRAAQHPTVSNPSSPKSSKRSLKHKLHNAIQQAEDTAPQQGVLERADAKSLCLQLLMEGRPAAFVDFFQLTHPAPASAAADADAAPAEAPAEHAEDVLLYVKQQLSAADAASRNGEQAVVYDSYLSLAKVFEELQDTGKARYFYTKARVAAQEAGWSDKELACLLALGQMCQAMGDLQQAAQHHELCRAVAAERGLPEQEQQALGHIAECYLQLAEADEAAGRQEEALQQYQSCLKAAGASGDKSCIGLVHHLIGKLLQDSEQHQEALQHHQQAAELLTELGDDLAAGRTLCAAAECQQQLGKLAEAAEALEAFLKISRSRDPEAEAAACCSLGVIYYQQQKWEPAVASFERFYQLAQGLSNRKMVDVARVNLGMARGAVRMGRFIELVQTDLPALIQWKNCRAPVW